MGSVVVRPRLVEDPLLLARVRGRFDAILSGSVGPWRLVVSDRAQGLVVIGQILTQARARMLY